MTGDETMKKLERDYPEVKGDPGLRPGRAEGSEDPPEALDRETAGYSHDAHGDGNERADLRAKVRDPNKP